MFNKSCLQMPTDLRYLSFPRFVVQSWHQPQYHHFPGYDYPQPQQETPVNLVISSKVTEKKRIDLQEVSLAKTEEIHENPNNQSSDHVDESCSCKIEGVVICRWQHLPHRKRLCIGDRWQQRSRHSSSASSNDAASIDSGFSSNVEPLSHHEIETVSRRFVCTHCPKTFSTLLRFRAHERRHLSKNSGKYRCHVCDKCFVQRSSLNTHVRIHSGERPFKCDVCTESFGDFSTFTKHRRIHTGEKPYACPVCTRAFSQSGNMHRHLKSIHGNDV